MGLAVGKNRALSGSDVKKRAHTWLAEGGVAIARELDANIAAVVQSQIEPHRSAPDGVTRTTSSRP